MTTSIQQPVLLRQSPLWSRTIAWSIIGITTFTLIWAAVFKIEEAIPAIGKLEPQASVQDIQAPVGGVVKAIHVKNGQRVKRGEVLVNLEPAVAQAQVVSLQKVRAALQQEVAFYRGQLVGAGVPETVNPQLAGIKASPELISLTKSRAAIAAENQLYRAQLAGTKGIGLSPEQQLRLQARQAENGSRLASGQLQALQVQQQFNQNQIKLTTSKQTLALNQGILKNMESVWKEGGISELQYRKQQQDVMTRQSDVAQQTQEQQRLAFAIAEANQKSRNSVALSQEDVLSKITANDKSLAELDSQITKAILEDQKRIAEIDSQLSQAQQTLQYQELKAPVDGTVFELKLTGPGSVTSTTEPVLKIVPNDSLIAQVYITNKDIGFVKEGMEADVRIDSFPFSEFGDVKGTLIWIGSDALPPDEIRPYYHFPAKVRIDRQSLMVNNREVPLQSGMSVSSNIKLRKRTILSIFTDLFAKQIESMKFVR